MSTLLDLVTKVKTIWKRTDNDTLDPAVAVNDTYKAMLACVGHHRLQDRVYKGVVVGQFELSLPTGILRINHPIKLIDPEGGSEATSSYPLTFLTKQDYDYWEPAPDLSQQDTNNPTTGIPWAYCLWKNSIYLTSIPDRSYTLEIAIGGEPADLLADGDLSILSSVWDETIMAGALARLFRSVKLYPDADQWQKIYLIGHESDGGTLIGGLKLLQQLDGDNTKGPIIVRNQPL